MKAILTIQNFTSDLVTSFWTPTFVGIFLAIVAYAVWPRNKAAFDEASKMPGLRRLRELGHAIDRDLGRVI